MNLLRPAALILFLAGLLSAQAPPTTVQRPRPHLKRDRTQRVLAPKIIQLEDERILGDDLLDLIVDSHGSVRRRAIIAAGRIGSPRAITQLIQVLTGDRDPTFRALAAFSLGEIESHHAVMPLLERLEDPKESAVVKGRAAEALGKIGSNRFSASALGSYGTGSMASVLVKFLPDPSAQLSPDERLLASLTLTALIRLKKASTVPAIVEQLRSVDADVRWQAANAIARIGEGLAVAAPLLLPLLEDKEWLVRAHAARALGVAKEKRAVEQLVKMLADPDGRAVANAINALAEIRDERAVEPLLGLGGNLLSEYGRYDRKSSGTPSQQNLLRLIARALGQIGDRRALPFLQSLRVVDGKPGGIVEVEVAVAKFGEAAFFDVKNGLKLQSDDWRAVAAYAQGLGELKTEKAVSLLRELLATAESRSRPDVLNALAAARVEGLRTILIEQLKHQDVIVRSTAATLLGDLGDSSEAVTQALGEALKAAASDEMNDARIAILETAEKLKKSLANQVLAGATPDPDYVVRKKAIELLRESAAENTLVKFDAGKVETGHDRAYWRRIAQLALSGKNPIATIHTKKGDIRIELFAADAPMTVENFIRLAQRGFYNGTGFMRVVPNFVIQGGDPRGDMNGGPGYQIRCEINLRRYGIGAVGMALSGKDTGGSQFFITHSPQPHLDGGYTVFGQVISGIEVVNRIARDDLIERIDIALND